MKGREPISILSHASCLAQRPLLPRQCLQQLPHLRSISTSSQRLAIAAPEIQFGDNSGTPPKIGVLQRARIVPASPSYFTAKPDFTDSLLQLQALLRKYEALPVLPPGQAPRIAWKTYAQYLLTSTEPVRVARYSRILKVLQRLNYIHPTLMPSEVASAMQPYKRSVNPHDTVRQPRVVDEFGRARGVGRRKTSAAIAWLVEGDGQVLVNGKSLSQAFGRIHDRESAIWPLKATERVERYNVWALVKGGGTTGQAEALTLAVANGLLVHEPELKPTLRRAGCVTRDARVVERKKHGKVKARKMPAWVKR